MIQQINLYADILKQQQKNAVIKLYLSCAGAVLLVWMGFSAYLLWDISKAEKELQSAQLMLKNEHILPPPSTAPEPVLNVALLAEIKQLQDSINEVTQIMALLTDSQSLVVPKFSSYFQALADQFVPDVWITAIHIAGKSRNVSLEGSTFKPEKVPQILDKLLQDPTFKGQSFDKFIMQPSPNKPEQTDFTLRSSKQPLAVNANVQ
ncbi:MAG: PilN domain-containing protein [Methylococcaceae bacterium]